MPIFLSIIYAYPNLGLSLQVWNAQTPYDVIRFFLGFTLPHYANAKQNAYSSLSKEINLFSHVLIA